MFCISEGNSLFDMTVYILHWCRLQHAVRSPWHPTSSSQFWMRPHVLQSYSSCQILTLMTGSERHTKRANSCEHIQSCLKGKDYRACLFLLTCDNQGVRYSVHMVWPCAPPVEESPRGCFLATEQIKTCHTDFRVSGRSHVEGCDFHQNTTCHDYIFVISVHAWQVGTSEERAAEIA